MAAPWRKKGGWPYEGPRGKRWHLGYRDHEGRTRARTFATKSEADAWAREYVRADRYDQLRAFLNGPAPAPITDQTPLAELILDWFATDAHPDSPGGLAPSTWDSYRSVASRHILGNPVVRHMTRTGEVVEVQAPIPALGDPGGYAIGHLPAITFQTSEPLKRWVKAMRRSGVNTATEARAWKVLSSALSWAVDEDSWPLVTNGCMLTQRRRGMRRASRRAGSGAERTLATAGKRRTDLAAWALSPVAVERIRLVMLERVAQRDPLLALRDATIVSVQYGLAMRNQEVYALSIGDVRDQRATVREVLSRGKLDSGKTEGATGPSRRPPIDALLTDDIADWVTALAAAGHPTGPGDFLFRGDLSGHGHGGGHMSRNQAHAWPQRYFAPAVAAVAERWPKVHGDILGATPYSLRRGMISLRIRAGEDRQAIARQCGTSVEMLERSYSFVIQDLEDRGPRPAEEERLHARAIASSIAA